jgi:hypothetical protein
MKPDISHIAKIRSMFAKMQTREDLLDVLNEAKKIMLGDDVSPFKISALTYFSNPKRTESEYTRFEIEKKSGALRQLHAPKEGLKKFQRVVSFVYNVFMKRMMQLLDLFGISRLQITLGNI